MCLEAKVGLLVWHALLLTNLCLLLFFFDCFWACMLFFFFPCSYIVENYKLMLSRIPPRLLFFSCYLGDRDVCPFLVYWYFTSPLWTSAVLSIILSNLIRELQTSCCDEIWFIFWWSIVPSLFRLPDHIIITILVVLMIGHFSYFF